MTTEQPSRKHRRLAWIGGGLATLLLIYTLFGFFGVPWLIETYGARRLGETLDRPVAIRRAAFNPFAFTLRLEGVTLDEKDGRPLVALAALDLDLALAASLGGTPTVRTLALTGPEVHVVRRADGSVNLADLAPPPSDPSPAAPAETDTAPPAFRLEALALRDGRVAYRDETAGEFATTVAPVTLALSNLTSLPGESGEYRLELRTEAGEELKLDGRLTLAQPTTEGRLALTGVTLAKYAPYYRPFVGIDRVEGRLDLSLAYRYADGAALVSALETTLSELALHPPGGGEPPVTLARLSVHGGRADAASREASVEAVELEGFAATARRAAGGRIDLVDLLAPPAAAPAPPAPSAGDETTATPSPWTVAVGQVTLGAGPLHFTDLAGVQPVRVDLERLTVDLADIRAAGADATVDRIEAGLDELVLRDPDGEGTFVRLPRLAVSGGRLDTAARAAQIGRIEVTGTEVDARRHADGRIDLAGLFVPPPGAQAAPAAPAAGPAGNEAAPWSVGVDVLALSEHRVRFRDDTTDPAAELVVDELALTVRDFSTAADAAPGVELAARVNETGRLAVRGDARLDPPAAGLAVEVRELAIQPFQPYFGERVGLIVTDGHVGVEGRLDVDLPAGGPPRVRYRGDVSVGRFASVDKRHARDFLRWENLFVEEADVATEPLQVTVAQVALSGYYARIIVNADGTLNLTDIVTPTSPGEPPAAEGPPPAEAQAEGEPLPVRIDRVTLQGGRVDFSDLLVQPHFETRMVELGGRVSGLSSDPATRADVLVKGALENQSPLEIVGRINPLARETYTDLKLTFRNIELSPFSAYSGKYLGYSLEKGKLTLELAYEIVNRKLQAENRIFFDALTLGDRVESPDATSLPVKLALALLTDRQGRIELDVPVQGDLDDPEFSIFHIVVKALVNLLTKIITSPFNALGALFSGEVVTELGFEPGASALDAEAEAKIAELAAALYQRPALRLEIEGTADPESDGPALRRQRFAELLRAAKLKEQAAAGRGEASLEAVTVAPEEFETYLERAYLAADFPKPRDADGKVKALPPAEMEKLLFTQIEIEEGDLRRLARERASAVRDRLLADERLAADRIFLVEPDVSPVADEDKARQVHFKLN